MRHRKAPDPGPKHKVATRMNNDCFPLSFVHHRVYCCCCCRFIPRSSFSSPNLVCQPRRKKMRPAKPKTLPARIPGITNRKSCKFDQHLNVPNSCDTVATAKEKSLPSTQLEIQRRHTDGGRHAILRAPLHWHDVFFFSNSVRGCHAVVAVSFSPMTYQGHPIIGQSIDWDQRQGLLTYLALHFIGRANRLDNRCKRMILESGQLNNGVDD